MANTKRVFEVTTKNVKRNKWLTISTVFVTIIVFILSSVLISASLITQKAVKYYEQRAQVIVFFKKGTAESDVFSFRDSIYNSDLIKEITYISQEEALAVYTEDFKDNPELISSVTSDSLPASLEIRAQSIDKLVDVIENINKAKETNATIDEVMYFKDVVDNIKTLSRIINIGSVVLISAMCLIAVSLIRVTIGLNIKLHQDEIRIMHLVGGSDKFIRTPFIIEGAFYGLAGGLFSAFLILATWYTIIFYTTGTNFSYWFVQMFVDFGLPFLTKLDPLFILIYILIHLTVGISLGLVSSYSAVHKYLNDESIS